jgi:5-methylcytosine-specific restriction endonuclease McrA
MATGDRVKLQTLGPRVPMLDARTVAPHHMDRKRGRAGVVDRERIRTRDHGLCQRCARRNLVTLGTQVDHVVALEDGGPDTDDNKELLCDPCHLEKTNEDRARRQGRVG